MEPKYKIKVKISVWDLSESVIVNFIERTETLHVQEILFFW